MVTKLILRFFFFPIEAMCSIVPERMNIWVFGSWSGRNYNDNTKHLFNYILDHEKGIRPIWLTKSSSIYDLLKSQGKECYYFYSIKGIYYSLASRVVCVSDSWVDLPLTAFLPQKRKLIVQLWHGTLLRKVDFSIGSLFKKTIRYIFLLYLGRDYDLVTSATYKNIEIFKNLFNVPREKIKIIGQPRNDIIFSKDKESWTSSVIDSSLVRFNKKDSYEESHEYALKRSSKYSKIDFVILLSLLLEIIKPRQTKRLRKLYRRVDKIFLYMPTWRDNTFNLLGKEAKFDQKKISKFLEDNKSILLIKHHYYDYDKYQNLPTDNRLIFINKVEDIYPMISWADVLLTDYSSIYFDFLLLDRPIIFTPFDMQTYGSQKGLYYDYDAVTPGPKGKNWDEVMEHMARLLKGEDKYKNRRRKMNKMFNHYNDQESSRRAYEEIKGRRLND